MVGGEQGLQQSYLGALLAAWEIDDQSFATDTTHWPGEERVPHIIGSAFQWKYELNQSTKSDFRFSSQDVTTGSSGLAFHFLSLHFFCREWCLWRVKLLEGGSVNT